MSDLIKRLRGWPGPRGYAKVSILRTMTEAADKIGDMQDEIEKLQAALLLARIAVSHACEDSGRLLYTQDLARIDEALGKKYE